MSLSSGNPLTEVRVDPHHYHGCSRRAHRGRRPSAGLPLSGSDQCTLNRKKVSSMPYRANRDLPVPVQAHLPPHAQDIYREAFNHAFAAHVGDPRQEEAAHRIAWAAVKRSYVKVGGTWIARAGEVIK